MDLIYRYDPFAPLEQQQISDATAAIHELVSGNDRFADFVHRMQQRTLGNDAGEPIVIPVSPIAMGLPLYAGAMPTQSPFAVVLGCSDARVPTEAVFDQQFNDLFVLRIAGNVLGSECLGSLHYAVRHLDDSLKLIVVLGHSKCGAVTAAVDTYLSVKDFADIAYTFPLRVLVDQIQIAVRGTCRAIEKVTGTTRLEPRLYRSLLIGAAVYVNAAVSALELKRELKLRGVTGPQVVHAVYDFASLRVDSSPQKNGPHPRLRPAPGNAEELVAYTEEIVDAFLSLDDEERDGIMMTVQG